MLCSVFNQVNHQLRVSSKNAASPQCLSRRNPASVVPKKRQSNYRRAVFRAALATAACYRVKFAEQYWLEDFRAWLALLPRTDQYDGISTIPPLWPSMQLPRSLPSPPPHSTPIPEQTSIADGWVSTAGSCCHGARQHPRQDRPSDLVWPTSRQQGNCNLQGYQQRCKPCTRKVSGLSTCPIFEKEQLGNWSVLGLGLEVKESDGSHASAKFQWIKHSTVTYSGSLE